MSYKPETETEGEVKYIILTSIKPATFYKGACTELYSILFENTRMS